MGKAFSILEIVANLCFRHLGCSVNSWLRSCATHSISGFFRPRNLPLARSAQNSYPELSALSNTFGCRVGRTRKGHGDRRAAGIGINFQLSTQLRNAFPHSAQPYSGASATFDLLLLLHGETAAGVADLQTYRVAIFRDSNLGGGAL